MRKRWKEPTIHIPTKDRPYFWFRITDSFGKKPVFKYDSYDKARKDRANLATQVLNAVVDTPSDRILLDHAIDFHLKLKKDLRGIARYYDYKRNFLAFCKEKGYRYVDEITPDVVDDYMLWRQENSGSRISKGGANNTINEERRFLGSVWETLIDRRKIFEYDPQTHSRNNPFSKVDPLPPKPKRKGKVIPKDELDMIFGCSIKEGIKTHIDWYGIFLTLYAGCGRKMEIVGIKPAQVDLERNEFRFPDTKTGVEKIIPIHSFIKPYIVMAKARAIKKKLKYLFPDWDKDVMCKNKPLQKIAQFCKKLGIDRYTVHDLRRTFGSNQKLSRETKMWIGGWKSKRTFDDVYNNPTNESLKQEYMKWKVDLPKPPADYLV